MPDNVIPRADPIETFNKYDNFIFDADGVLWLDNYVIPGAIELLQILKVANKRLIILTNNSTKSPCDLVTKCKKIGFEDITIDNIVSAGAITAHEIKKFHAANPEAAKLPIYLNGSFSLKKYLEEETGVECIGCGPDYFENYTQDNFLMNVDISRKVSAVVTSFDFHLSYIKIMKAVNYLKDENVLFIATNEDLTFPGSVPGITVPGAGTVSIPIRAITGREPIVMGKPHKAAFNYLREKFGINPSNTIMIGDRCDTDISFGNQNGIDTLLVLTGIHSLLSVEKYKKNSETYCIPKMYIESVKNLII